MDTNKFRASFSILNTWAMGDYDRAIKQYFRLEDFDTPAMKRGREYHKMWDSEIKQTNMLPKVFGGKRVTQPQTELKIERELDSWLDLVGVIDLYSEETIYDWKTGKTPAQSINPFQVYTYQILLPKSIKAEIHRHDPDTMQTDMIIYHLTDKTLEQGIEWVLTLSSEMQNYLIQNRLYERFGGNDTKRD